MGAKQAANKNANGAVSNNGSGAREADCGKGDRDGSDDGGNRSNDGVVGATSPHQQRPSSSRLGRKASHVTAGPPWKLTIAITIDGTEAALVLLLTVAALATRLYNIHQPPSVAWDETHFGKFANRYLRREFYFDVHPPLAKMMIALAGLITGYRGDFDFEGPGTPYGDHIYIGMRAFCACVGAMCVPLSYLTVREMDRSRAAALIAASFVLFDTACITASKYILLDPILMFFIHAACYAAICVRRQNYSVFSVRWWLSYAALGLLLGCAISSKWVGLFVVLFVGCLTVADLWELWGDTTLSLGHLLAQFSARAVTLILLPLATYAFFFLVHFCICNHSGDGDAFMSSAFQTTLKGNELSSTPMPNLVALGSGVSIKAARCSGALLHSHPHLYPSAMLQQQQITGYQHKDANNLWVIKAANPREDISDDYSQLTPHEPIHYITSGDIIRLEHKMTRVNLHSHGMSAFSKKTHQQVTGYGAKGVGDVNDRWMVEVFTGNNGHHLGRITDRFKLLHAPFGTPMCALSCDGTKYPEWGFEQLEVTCNPDLNASSVLWNIERHDNPRLPPADVATVRPSFWASLLELHVAMAEVNNGLVPKKGEDPSRPWHWPINYRGQRFTAWGDDDLRIYLLGNHVVFMMNLAAVVLFILCGVLLALAQQRGTNVDFSAWQDAGWLFLGWLLHYLPFYVMDRVLYFHHYLPAILFNCMLSGIVFDWIMDVVTFKSLFAKHPRIAGCVKAGAVVAVVGAAAWGFMTFKCLSYGMTGPLRSMKPLMWMPSWELDH